MNLNTFIRNFVCPNSLIRLWVPNDKESGYKMLSNENNVCMEWEITKKQHWMSNYGHCEVIGVKDIYVDDFYREAINIVIKED